MNFSKIIQDQLDGHFAAVEKLRAQTGFIEDLARRVIAALESGKKIIFFGNGGSAADAQHLAAEFVVRYRRNRRALPAIALSTDTSILTAGGNDFGFESIYARQIEALAVAGDIAIGISTSGNSANVIAALQAAKDNGCVTVAFTGSAKNRCSQIAEITFHAPSEITAHIQECHIIVGHILCELVETHVIDG
jgi:D-sedoheptulose 7-phosphate isomerase